MFSNYDYDIIIIGGGISGLFLTYKLSSTGLKIIMIEGNALLGGRIKTIQRDDISFEAGSARFHSSHTKLITLINELNLQDEITDLPKETTFKLPKKSKIPLKTLLEESSKQRKNYKKEYLMNITYFQ